MEVSPERSAAPVTFPFGTFVVYDLSPVFEEGMASWHTHPPLLIRQERTHVRHGYFAQTLVMCEHTGSHVDAPAHVDASDGAQTVEFIPPDALISTAKRYDLAAYELEPGMLVPLSVLREIEERDGFHPSPGEVALIDFGWERFLEAADGWWGRNQPGLAEDACSYLADSGIRAVASDTAACDSGVRDGVATGNFGHEEYFLPRGIYIVEGLRNLASVPIVSIFLALPLKIRGGSGSPIRPLALEPVLPR